MFNHNNFIKTEISAKEKLRDKYNILKDEEIRKSRINKLTSYISTPIGLCSGVAGFITTYFSVPDFVKLILATIGFVGCITGLTTIILHCRNENKALKYARDVNRLNSEIDELQLENQVAEIKEKSSKILDKTESMTYSKSKKQTQKQNSNQIERE